MQYPDKHAAMLAGAAFQKKAEKEGFVGLTLDVFCNAGWHVCLRGNMLQFWPDEHGTLSVLAGAEGGGRCTWTTSARFATFAAAWQSQLDAADAEIRQLKAIRDKIADHLPARKKGR